MSESQKDIIRLIPVRKQEFKHVEVTLVHPSKILPSRQTVREVVKSVEKDGIKQPPVVRPDPNIQGTYEIIDGANRLEGARSSVLTQTRKLQI